MTSLPYAVTSEELRERAYEAFARGDWTMGRRLFAKANWKRAETVYGPYSAKGMEAFRQYRLATAQALQTEIGR